MPATPNFNVDNSQVVTEYLSRDVAHSGQDVEGSHKQVAIWPTYKPIGNYPKKESGA